jgi:hypothetical protein
MPHVMQGTEGHSDVPPTEAQTTRPAHGTAPHAVPIGRSGRSGHSENCKPRFEVVTVSGVMQGTVDDQWAIPRVGGVEKSRALPTVTAGQPSTFTGKFKRFCGRDLNAAEFESSSCSRWVGSEVASFGDRHRWPKILVATGWGIQQGGSDGI